MVYQVQAIGEGFFKGGSMEEEDEDIYAREVEGHEVLQEVGVRKYQGRKNFFRGEMLMLPLAIQSAFPRVKEKGHTGLSQNRSRLAGLKILLGSGLSSVKLSLASIAALISSK